MSYGTWLTPLKPWKPNDDNKNAFKCNMYNLKDLKSG